MIAMNMLVTNVHYPKNWRKEEERRMERVRKERN